MLVLQPAAAGAATLIQLQSALLETGLLGDQFRLSRQGQNWLVESNQLYTSAEELKLSLVQVARLLATREDRNLQVTLRARLLGRPGPVQCAVTSRQAGHLLKANGAGLARMAIVLYAGALPQMAVLPRTQLDQRRVVVAPRAANLPVIGEPLTAGQPVADPARGDGTLLRTGSAITVTLEKGLTVSGDQSVPVRFVVVWSVLDELGSILIPSGSIGEGQVQSNPEGARLVLQQIDTGERKLTLSAATPMIPAYRQSTGANGTLAGGMLGTVLGGGLGAIVGGLLGGLFNAPPPPKAVVLQGGGTYILHLTDDLKAVAN